MGVDLVAIDSGHGSGQWFSAASVALPAAVLFGVRLTRTVACGRGRDRAGARLAGGCRLASRAVRSSLSR